MSGSSRKKRFMASAKQKKKQQAKERRRQQQEEQLEQQQEEQQQQQPRQLKEGKEEGESKGGGEEANVKAKVKSSAESQSQSPRTSESDENDDDDDDDDDDDNDRKLPARRIPLDESADTGVDADVDVDVDVDVEADADADDTEEGESAHARCSSLERLVQGWEMTIVSEPPPSSASASASASRPRVRIRPSAERPPISVHAAAALDLPPNPFGHGTLSAGRGVFVHDDDDDDDDNDDDNDDVEGGGYTLGMGDPRMRPVLFAYTHSSPLQRTGGLFGGSDDEAEEETGARAGAGAGHATAPAAMLASTGTVGADGYPVLKSWEKMRRSVSTPSPFRRMDWAWSSAPTAGGAMAGSTGGSGRVLLGSAAQSAFSRPRRDGSAARLGSTTATAAAAATAAARSEPGARSAFDPVWTRPYGSAGPGAFSSASATVGRGADGSAKVEEDDVAQDEEQQKHQQQRHKTAVVAAASSAIARDNGGTEAGDDAGRSDAASGPPSSATLPSKSPPSSSGRRSRFFPDIKALRRRKVLGGRENPARPSSTSSSSVSPNAVSEEDDVAQGDDDNVGSNDNEEEEVGVAAIASVTGASPILRASGSPGPTRKADVDIVFSYSIDEDKETEEFEVTCGAIGAVPPAHSRHYESLGSEDVEDADFHPPHQAFVVPSSPGLSSRSPSTTPRFRADSHDSPLPVAYQRIVDDDFITGPPGPSSESATGVPTPPPPSQRHRTSAGPPAGPPTATPPHSFFHSSSRGSGAAATGPAEGAVSLTLQPRFILPPKSPSASNLSPSSHGSGSLSRVTLNTSSQTHSSTGTSGTLISGSDGKINTSSAEADREVREVMEATRAANRRRMRGWFGGGGGGGGGGGNAPTTPPTLVGSGGGVHHAGSSGGEVVVAGGGSGAGLTSVDGSASVQSVSTAGSSGVHHPRAYMNLAASPGPLREGASLPVDRFFQGATGAATASTGSPGRGGGASPSIASLAQISVGSNASSMRTGSSGQRTASPGGGAAQGSPSSAAHRMASARAGGGGGSGNGSGSGGNGSPVTISSSSAANTMSSSSTGSERPPPRFVSYLDRKTAAGAVLVKTSSPPRMPLGRIARVESIDEGEERESLSALREGYSELDGGEEQGQPLPPKQPPSKSKKEKLKRWISGGGGGGGSRARPPLSPVKTSGGSCTPPPHAAGGESPLEGTPLSRSPPRRIVASLDVDGRDDIQRVGPARPQVVRSSRIPPVSTGDDFAAAGGVLLSPSEVLGSGIMTTLHGGDGAQEVFDSSSVVGVVSPEGHRVAVTNYGASVEPYAADDAQTVDDVGEKPSWTSEGAVGSSPSQAVIVTPEKPASMPNYG